MGFISLRISPTERGCCGGEAVEHYAWKDIESKNPLCRWLEWTLTMHEPTCHVNAWHIDTLISCHTLVRMAGDMFGLFVMEYIAPRKTIQGLFLYSYLQQYENTVKPCARRSLTIVGFNAR